jgi:branched-chain amino acid transport system ATP-binding protein
MMTPTAQVRPAPETPPSPIEVESVSLTLSGARILDDVTFGLQPGEVVGLIGPNGAGKTTLINVIAGITRPSSGVVRLNGVDVTRSKPHVRAQRGLGRTFQTSNLFGGLTVEANVRLAKYAEHPGLSTGFRVPRRDPETAEVAAEVLSRVGLAKKARMLAGDLSHGDKRKLELATVIATKSDVLLLDEPMAGVNLDDVAGLIDLIGEIQRQTRAAVLFVEHHMEVVLSLSDRIAVLHHGALLAIDEPARVMKNETVQTAYIGDAL